MSKPTRTFVPTRFGFARQPEAVCPAKKFSPHSFDSKIEFIGRTPRILLGRTAYKKMWHYVDIAEKEVGWLGAVSEIGRDFLIDDVFLFRQTVSAAEADITTQGLAEFGIELLKLPDGADLWSRIRFWGHSHVNMSTSPSGQDDRQMEDLAASESPYFIRGILNKGGRMEFTIYFYETGIKIRDAEWELYEDADENLRPAIEAEFKEKVKESSYMSGRYTVRGNGVRSSAGFSAPRAGEAADRGYWSDDGLWHGLGNENEYEWPDFSAPSGLPPDARDEAVKSKESQGDEEENDGRRFDIIISRHQRGDGEGD